MNHYAMLTTSQGTKARCGAIVDRATEANPVHPINCPVCLSLLAAKAAAEFRSSALATGKQERDFHAATGTMFARYATGKAA